MSYLIKVRVSGEWVDFASTDNAINARIIMGALLGDKFKPWFMVGEVKVDKVNDDGGEVEE